MRPTWLIEAGVYGAELDPLIEEIRRQGSRPIIAPYRSLQKSDLTAEELRPESCVVGYGTYPFAQQILLHYRWIPGAWCSERNLDCAVYFEHFKRYLLNQQFVILPGIEAIRQRDWLFWVFGRDERVFARPTSCDKLFVGRCIDRDSFADALSPTRYNPETLVVVAAPQTIGREWRLVVVDGRVVSGSQYAVAGKQALAPGCPTEVVAYAESILSYVSWRPDPAFMLDICESLDELRLVELNSFSGSWMYDCDYSAVVSAVGNLARCTWEHAAAVPVSSDGQ